MSEIKENDFVVTSEGVGKVIGVYSNYSLDVGPGLTANVPVAFVKYERMLDKDFQKTNRVFIFVPKEDCQLLTEEWITQLEYSYYDKLANLSKVLGA